MSERPGRLGKWSSWDVNNRTDVLSVKSGPRGARSWTSRGQMLPRRETSWRAFGDRPRDVLSWTGRTTCSPGPAARADPMLGPFPCPALPLGFSSIPAAVVLCRGPRTKPASSSVRGFRTSTIHARQHWIARPIGRMRPSRSLLGPRSRLTTTPAGIEEKPRRPRPSPWGVAVGCRSSLRPGPPTIAAPATIPGRHLSTPPATGSGH
jgi:hypothetical protein